MLGLDLKVGTASGDLKNEQGPGMSHGAATYQKSYQSHDGRELPLMLDGSKPFAFVRNTIFNDTLEGPAPLIFNDTWQAGRLSPGKRRNSGSMQ